MNRQELFKQADYASQRGNRELAKKYLEDLLAKHPNDESAWMLMARIEQKNESKAECYERVLKINPNNGEARLGFARVKQALDPKLARMQDSQRKASASLNGILRAGLILTIVAILFGSTTLVIARNNPDSSIAHFLAVPTPTLYNQFPITDEIASQTRSTVSEKYPQYAPLLDIMIGLMIENASNGMDGAPERPGAEIVPSDVAGLEAQTIVDDSLPRPGSLSTLMLNELQVTSWLNMEMKKNPDIPLSDIQVYLRDGKIQFWGMVNGSGGDASTSALAVGSLNIDGNGKPYFEITSLQVGKQSIPGAIITQAESWLNQVLTEGLASQAAGLKVMNINVSNGLLTVSGMR